MILMAKKRSYSDHKITHYTSISYFVSLLVLPHIGANKHLACSIETFVLIRQSHVIAVTPEINVSFTQCFVVVVVV